MNLRSWPGLLVATVALAWPVLVVAYFWWRLNRLMEQQPSGIAAVSGSLFEMILLLLGPPAVLVVSWLLVRRSR